MRTLRNILHAHFLLQCVVMGCGCLSEFPRLKLLLFLVLTECKMDPDSLFKSLRFADKTPDFIENVVQCLPTAVKTGGHDIIVAFLGAYPVFATTWEAFHLMMKM